MIGPPQEVIDSALEALRTVGIEEADLLVTLGSGQANPWEDEVEVGVTYQELPGWYAPGVAGHGGKLSLVRVGPENVLVMAGRHHYYEARSYEAVITPLRVSHALGVRRALLINSVGALRSRLRPGDLVLLSDHIFLQGPQLPLLLQGAWPQGVQPGYWKEGGTAIVEAAGRAGIPVTEGVLLCVPGPMYETRAEAEMARRLGADVVAMSLAPEALIARALGCRVVGISLVTNTVGETGHADLHHEEVIAAAARFQPTLTRLLREAIPALAAVSDDEPAGH